MTTPKCQAACRLPDHLQHIQYRHFYTLRSAPVLQDHRIRNHGHGGNSAVNTSWNINFAATLAWSESDEIYTGYFEYRVFYF
ncbi:hypothetical protein M8J77_013593 [Diaphorina citri]|nr:hypothetical protein M8J77_013593 [Diaphorina citri]